MASLNIPYSFTNGTPANATEVNSNFSAVKSFAEGSLVSVDGAVKAPTSAIEDLAVTTAKIADNAVTNAKLPAGYASLTYQDHTIYGLTSGYISEWYTAPTKLTLTGGKTYQNVVSAQCIGGLNAYGVYCYVQGLGVQGAVHDPNNITVQAAVSNNAASGNYAIVRIWTT